MVELAEEWRSIVKGAVQRGEVGGVSLLFIKDGKEICWLGEGYADRENKREIKRDTIFRLYSMTKPVTAVAGRSFRSEAACGGFPACIPGFSGLVRRS